MQYKLLRILKRAFKNTRRFLTKVLCYPLFTPISWLVYPNTLIKHWSKFKNNSHVVLTPKHDNDLPTVYFLDVTGNAGVRFETHWIATTTIYWPFLSLKDYAIKTAEKIKELDHQIQNNPSHSDRIVISSISIGGAATILAVDYLIQEGYEVKTPITIEVSNTFDSLSAVIMDVLEEIGLFLFTVFAFIITSSACLAMMLLGVPTGQFALFAYLCIIPATFCMRILRALPTASEICTIALSALAFWLLGPCTLPCIAAALIITSPISNLVVYFFLESTESHMSIRKVYDRIQESKHTLKDSLFVSQMLYSDRVLNSNTLLKNTDTVSDHALLDDRPYDPPWCNHCCYHGTFWAPIDDKYFYDRKKHTAYIPLPKTQ